MPANNYYFVNIMKITLLQTDIIWGDPIANRRHIEDLLEAAPESDVYVLPEMFSTGFATQPEGIAESLEKPDNSYEWMLEMAVKYDAAIAGSVATETRGRGNEGKDYYNRFYFAKPDGGLAWYDKKHLFTYGGEHKRYTAGNERIIVEFRGVKFLLQVCYDMRFPKFARNSITEDGIPAYDVALYVASWPTVRVGAWEVLAHARAIENQCYVAAVNRVGKDPACEYSGGTMLIDPYGKTQVECERDKECFVTGEIDMDKLNAFREKFPVLKDAD